MSKVMKYDKQVLVPKLRFPEFRANPPFEWKKLNELLFETKKRNRELKFNKNDVLSVSGEYGCVNQVEFLGRSYAGETVNDYHLVETGDIVYTKSPLKKNPYGIIKENKGRPGIVSTLYAVYRTTKICRADYLDHYFSRDYNLNSYLQPLVNKGAKNDMKVKNSDVLLGEILVPDIDEQQKLADGLSSLDALIAAQAEKIDALKTYKKGLTQQLFPREGATVPRLRFPEFRDAGEWKVKTLQDIAKITSGGTPNRAELTYWGGSIPWVTTSLIDFNRIDSAEEFITTEGLNNSSAKLFPAKTLLMAMYGQGKTRGKVALLGIEATTNQACAAVTFNDEVDVDFAFQNLASRYNEIRKLSNEGGQENLSGGLIKSIVFVHPCLTEQQKIADCLSSLDALINSQREKIDALKTHKRGLMQQLFPDPEAMGHE